jgi:hypothetical protein
LPSNFWRIYAMGFPEGFNVKAPEEIFASLEPFFILIHKNERRGKWPLPH